MAHELIASVTATPAGPITIGLGETVDITASYALNGANPNGPSTSLYSLGFLKASPSPGSSWGAQIPAVEDTDYTKTCPTTTLNAVEKYELKVRATCITDVDTTFEESATIMVHVVPFSEDHGTSGSWDEGEAASGSMSEESAASGGFSEESAASASMTEEQAASGTWTEGT